MKYNVKIENFEGPFDLLLRLVMQKKVDVGQISITDIIDQYLEEVAKIDQVDLDTSSGFLLVASSLLKIKTDYLLKIQGQDESQDSDAEEMSSSQARDALIAKLLLYKQFKDASVSLKQRSDVQSKMFPRLTGPDPQYLNLTPNFLKNSTVDKLATLAAQLFANRDQFLLDAQHIASKPIPVVLYVKKIYEKLQDQKNINFSQLIEDNAACEIIVVNFLAILELYKHDYIELVQLQDKGDINIQYVANDRELDISNIDINN